MRRLASPSLDLDAAAWIEGVELPLGAAVLAIERGLVVPARLDDGTVVELVFVGHAGFRLQPPDEIEAGQLELFTGEPRLDAPVEEAVLATASGTHVAALLDGRPPATDVRPDLAERVARVYTAWLEGTERRTIGVEASLFKALVGDAGFSEFFALWGRGFRLGEFVYHLDPEDHEPLTLASFEPLELSRWQRAELRRHIRLQQRKGRWLGVRARDIGAWDMWMSTGVPDRSGADLPGQVGFETTHYELDVKILRDRMRLDGRATLDLEAVGHGRRVVTLGLFRDLQPRRITDGLGRELFWTRFGDELHVLRPEPSTDGERSRLVIDYGGRVLHWVRGKAFDLGDTGYWYPHCGTVDRATYDVTLRWPKKYDVIAGGRLVAEGREGRYRWQRRRLDVPAIAFSFAMGRFDVEHRRVGDIDVRVAFNSSRRGRLTDEVRQATLDSVAASLAFFQDAFGPLPVSDLTVVTVPRPYSQSYLGFITLADSTLEARAGGGRAGRWRLDATVAHELAHQWWGNVVGWWSYRDQWLSEGMANYAALLFASESSDDDSDLLAAMSAGWRESLGQRTPEGRTVESMGPVVLGARLNSSKAAHAYRAVVYRKGAVVLAMLARAMGEEKFVDMLGALATERAFEVLTTEAFLEAVEAASGLDIDGFARQFVYGTGIPQVHYDYDVARDEQGGWRFLGEAQVLSTPRWRHAIVPAGAGSPVRWTLSREPRQDPADDSRALMVPFVVLLDPDAQRSVEVDGARQGRLFLQGRHDLFEIRTDERPSELVFDPRGEILARFYSASAHPKRVLRYQARDDALAGRADQAESRFLAALEAPAQKPEGDDLDRLLGSRSRVEAEDARIRLDLVRLYVDRGRDAEALAELDAADAVLEEVGETAYLMERDVLRSLIELRGGQPRPAYERLHRTLRRMADRSRIDWRTFVWRMRVASERTAVTEGWALLAIAAHALGETDEFLWALEHAAERGVDVSAIAPPSPDPVAPVPEGPDG